MTIRPGSVYLVGAGPGDPGLITVRGREVLRRADVVLHDRLVERALLDEAPPCALVESVGKASQGDSALQGSINARLVRYASEGRVVVRLKGGDPLVFGRGWEEQVACREAGIPCEIIPGISSALAAPASVGIPVTLRNVASSVAITSGASILSASVARADTTVILMGVGELRGIAQRLIASGVDAATPAAVIERATCPGERVVTAPLDDIAEAAEAEHVAPPAVLVVGPTVAYATSPRASGSLASLRVVVTRPHEASHELIASLRAAGAHVIAAPLIRIEYPTPERTPLLARAWDYDWIVFTSRHGVRGFRRALENHGADVRALGHARIASVGPITSRELRAWGIRPDVEPTTYRANSLVQALLAHPSRPRRVLFPSGTLALDTLPRGLRAQGIEVEPVTVYDTLECPLDPGARRDIERGVHAVVLASPSAARALGRSGVDLGGAAAVCIGETTADAARPWGWNVAVAAEHSDAGLVAALHDLPLGSVAP